MRIRLECLYHSRGHGIHAYTPYLASSRSYCFNASIRRPPETLNRRKGTGTQSNSVGRRLL